MTRKSAKSTSFIAGIILIGLSGVAWLALLFVPFLDTSVVTRSTIAGGLIVGAEIVFWLGTLLIGKEAYGKFKEHMKIKK